MKIRTRLLLFLLPTLIGSIALISTLLAYHWRGEIVEGFRARLKPAVAAAASRAGAKELETLREQLGLSQLRLLSEGDAAALPADARITSLYRSADGRQLMTAYAPLFDETGRKTGVLAADIDVDLIEKKFQESLLLILLCAGFTILVMVATLFLIANKISRPVQQLNNSALAIAAGQYGESIQVQGPREIAELANTLNTMSECLYENMNRVKENSLLRERMYGEYECAMLLQHMMLQKNIDECRSDAVAVKSITFFSASPRGLLLDFPKAESNGLFHIHMAEASEEGFEGMYQLLTQYKQAKQTQTDTCLLFDRAASTLALKGPRLPFVWSLDEERFLEPAGNSLLQVDSGDFFFLFNQGLLRFYKSPARIGELLSKVLKVFASDGLETTAAMIHKEIAFATKRKDLEEDIHLLCFQVLNP